MTSTRTCNSQLGFSIHTLVFALTIPLLLAIDVWAGGPLWIHWVLVGWGPGLLAHWWFGPARPPRTAAA